MYQVFKLSVAQTHLCYPVFYYLNVKPYQMPEYEKEVDVVIEVVFDIVHWIKLLKVKQVVLSGNV